MKKIIIMRHAKSDWADSSLPDIERPLNSRGQNDAPHMGEEIKRLNIVPDKIISSPAVRATQTAKAVVKSCGFSGDIEIEDCFYFGNKENIIKTLQKIPENCSSVMIFGHNPTWEELTYKLCGKYQVMSTASVVVLTFQKKWKELEFLGCTFDFVLSPKEI